MQDFMVTNDMGCGLTIGPKHASEISICKLIVDSSTFHAQLIN